MRGKAEPAENGAAAQVAIHDLRTAASHLQSAATALSGHSSSVTAAYVEQALHHCRMELAALLPVSIPIGDGTR